MASACPYGLACGEGDGDLLTPSAFLSRRCAVDDDFSESGRENSEYLIVEPLDEQFRHTAKMDRHGSQQPLRSASTAS
jgi:hypothetical protein